jgi:DNA-binding Lrp family transcriptional regulator
MVNTNITETDFKRIAELLEGGVPKAQIRKLMAMKVEDFALAVLEMERRGILPKRKTGKDRLNEAIENGETNPHKIAEISGLKLNTVRFYLTTGGVKLGRPKRNYVHCDRTESISDDLREGVLSTTEIAQKHGVSRQAVHNIKRKMIEDEIARLEKTTVAPTDELNALLESCNSTPVSTGIKLAELLRRPELDYKALAPIDKNRPELPSAVCRTAEVQVKYAGYIKRELAEVERQSKLEGKLLSSSIDYKSILGLRIEAAEKLDKIRPQNLGQASRISGVSPADISVLMIYLSDKHKNGQK